MIEIPNISGFLKKNRVEVIIVLALFFIAFGIRFITSEKFPTIYGFDSFYESRASKYVAEQGYPWPNNDSVTDYPFNRGVIFPGSIGWSGMNALIYNVAHAIMPNFVYANSNYHVNEVDGFNFDLFGMIASWMTVITGSLAIPAMYLFGRYAFSRWVGLSSALLLAGSPNHLFYSIYGHAENDAFGFSLFFMALFSFVITIKNKSWKMGLVTVAILSWLSMVWQTYVVAAFILSATIFLYFVAYALFDSFGYYKNSPERDEHRKWMIYALLFCTLTAIPYLFHVEFDVALVTYPPIAIFTFGGAALVCSLIEVWKKKKKVNLQTVRTDPVVKPFGIAVLVMVMGLLVFQTKIIVDPLTWIGILKPPGSQLTDYNQRLLTTIAEQNPISGANFFDRVETLANTGFGNTVWLALFAVALSITKFVIMPFARKDFKYEWDILIFGFVLFSLWTLTSKAITLFFLSGAVAMGAGYFLGNLVNIVNLGRKYLEKYIIYLHSAVVVIILIISFSYLTFIVPNVQSYGYDVPVEWFQTFRWLNDKAPNNTVITTWWDYGHWINYYAGDNKNHEVYTNLDNIQDRADIIFTVASAYTHTSPCSQDPQTNQINCQSSQDALDLAENESLSLLEPLRTTHILVDKEIVLGKFNALMRIANNYLGCFQNFGCVTDQNGNVACLVGQVNQGGQIRNVGYAFSKEQWNLLTGTPWPGIVANLSLAVLGTSNIAAQINTRYFAKDENFSGKTLYAASLSCGNDFFQSQVGANPNAPLIYSFEQRLFFKDQTLKHVKLVYEDGWNIIYQVNFDEIPSPDNYTDWTKTNSVVCKGPFATAPGCPEYKG